MSHMSATRFDGETLVREFRFIRLVSDLSALRAFYDDVFDWPVTGEWAHGVMYDTGAATVELIQEPHADEPNSACHISISVPDVAALFERLKDRTKIVFPLRDNSWGDTSFQISDPDGFLITLFTPK